MSLYVLIACTPAKAERASPNIMGAMGLNIVPSARMADHGNIRFHASTLDPYMHGTLGFQIAKPLYVGIRQSAEISNINDTADRLLPGIDIGLRLLNENTYRPAITLGLQSAIGHKRMAGEYLSFSKRYNDFDFTAGMAWGRLGSAAHMSNPLKAFSKHFGKTRALDGESPNAPDNWFTGKDIGFFAGLEYFTSVDGLSIKADWGADRYIAEQTLFDYDPPDPWALGANYAPADWVNIGAALIGGQKLMGTLTLRAPVSHWQGRRHEKKKVHHLRAYRTGLALPHEMAIAAARDEILLYEPRHENNVTASAILLLDPHSNTPEQIGHTSRHMANHAGQYIEELRITPMSYGLQGDTISLQRHDLEQALIHHQGSAQEIWRNVSFKNTAGEKSVLNDRFNPFDYHGIRLILANDLSLSEEDSGLLYRTSLLIEETRKLSEHLWTGGSFRLDLKNNLEQLNDLRPLAILPVRSNVDQFAQRTISLDRAYMSWMTTIKPDLHIALTGGLLEEMYAGIGGEVLYRPFGKTWAIGVEAHQAFKRDPFQDLNIGFNGDRLLTGHLNLYYEVPQSDLTFQFRAGRYLAEDIGGTFAIHKHFDNGAKLQAFVTATDTADFDIFGSTTHVYSGLKLSLPVGNVKYVPKGSEIRIAAAPFGRDSGQALDAPIKLYDVSEPLSYRHITRHWNGVVD